MNLTVILHILLYLIFFKMLTLEKEIFTWFKSKSIR